MQNTSELWKDLRATPGTILEYAFDVNGVRYGAESEVGHSVTGEIFSDLSIGNATSKQLSLSLYADDIPRGATINRYVRLKNGERNSEWLPKGTFFTNTRSQDDGVWTISAVDPMRKADAPYLSNADNGDWPRLMVDVVRDIADRIGVDVDTRTIVNPAYYLQHPADMSMRDILRHIGAAHGANWFVTDACTLLMLPVVPATGHQTQHDVGFDVVSFEDNGFYMPISRVTLFVDNENTYTAGDDTGFELSAECFSATQDMVDFLLGQLYGYRYRAFNAGDVNIDPAFELGDSVSVCGIDGVLTAFSDNGDGYPTISAPGSADIDEEYPVESPIKREFDRKIAETRSEIKKTAESIKLSVENGETESQITLSVGGVEVAGEKISFSGYATFEGLESGKTVIDGGCIKADSKITAPNIVGGKVSAGEGESEKSYALMTGTGWGVYNKDGVSKIRLGYTSVEYDFPFVELGSGFGDGVSKGLIKKFTDGLWIGNSAVAEANGEFVPKAGYNGMFFSFTTGKAYVVQGTNMQNIYTGEAIAKFG